MSVSVAVIDIRYLESCDDGWNYGIAPLWGLDLAIMK